MDRPGMEYRYDIDPGAPLPSLGQVGSGLTVSEPVETEFKAVYFDTPDLALARHGATLRQCSGDAAEGWRLAQPAGGGGRTELRAAVDDAARGVPPSLLVAVRAVARHRTLEAIVVLRIGRTVRHLLDGDGRDLAAIVDEIVQAQRLGAPAVLSTWREVGVELIDGAQPLMEALHQRLESAGLRRSPAQSMLIRALDNPSLTSGTELLSPKSPAGAVIAQYLREQIHELISRDNGARTDVPDAVHKMRVATRRLRSALATYRPLLAVDTIQALREELAWLGAVLGQPRDAEVLRDRLRASVARLDDDLVLGPVAARIETQLTENHQGAHQALVRTLDGDRYLRLLDDLETLADTPALTDRAHRSAHRELNRLVARACRRVDQAAARAERAQGTHEYPIRLHDVRKAAKRARYACESVSTLFSQHALELAGRMEGLQELLGEHQDTIIASHAIQGLALAAFQAGENSFTYGILHAAEADHAAAALQAYPDALRACQQPSARSWLH